VRHLAVLLCITAVSGCVHQPAKTDAANTPLFTTIFNQPLMAGTVFRDGDNLNFQALGPLIVNTTQHSTLQMEASCTSPQIHVMYVNNPKRIYLGSRDGSYVSPRSLATTMYPTLAQNPSFIQACAEPQPDWRLLKQKSSGQWVMLDRNSVKTQGTETLFWGAFDEQSILFDLPYNAPYAQKREHYAVDCAKQTYRVLAGYDVDVFNRVTDGLVSPVPAVEPITAGIDADYALLFKQVCSSPEQLAKLPAFTRRNKAPVVTSLTGVTTPVLSAIQYLNLPPAVKPLHYIAFSGTVTLKEVTTATNEESFLSIDAATGQLAIIRRAEGYEGREVNWRGLIPLVKETRFGGGVVDSLTLSSLSFSGDWQQMPVGAVLSYSTQSHSVNSLAGEYSSKEARPIECTVKRALQASELNAGLSGAAKELSCSQLGSKYPQVSHVYYLTDYAYFFKASSDKNAFFYDERRLQSIN
jgi:hypothetical protein